MEKRRAKTELPRGKPILICRRTVNVVLFLAVTILVLLWIAITVLESAVTQAMVDPISVIVLTILIAFIILLVREGAYVKVIQYVDGMVIFTNWGKQVCYWSDVAGLTTHTSHRTSRVDLTNVFMSESYKTSCQYIVDRCDKKQFWFSTNSYKNVENVAQFIQDLIYERDLKPMIQNIEQNENINFLHCTLSKDGITISGEFREWNEIDLERHKSGALYLKERQKKGILEMGQATWQVLNGSNLFLFESIFYHFRGYTK